MIDLAFPALGAIDGWLAVVFPATVRVCVWGALSGAAALMVYWMVSDQAGIARLKFETRQLRSRMLDLRLEQSEFTRLAGQNLVLSLHFLRKTGLPSILSSFPVIVVVCWLAAYYTYALPPAGTRVAVDVMPPETGITAVPAEAFVRDQEGLRLNVGNNTHAVRIADDTGVIYAGNPTDPPTGSVSKKKWWNTLVENEAGYIQADSLVEEIRWRFPRRVLIDGLPEWAGTWEFPFFTSLFVVALALKVGFRIY